MDSDIHPVKNFRELLQDRVMKRLEAKADYGKKNNPDKEILYESPTTILSTSKIWDRVGERVASKHPSINQTPSSYTKNHTSSTVSISNSTDDIKTRIRAMSKAIGFASQIQDNLPKHTTDRAAQIVRKISAEGKSRAVLSQDKKHTGTEQMLDLSQFGMKNLLEEASSVYEETLSQGKFMEDDYFSLPSVASTQSLFSNISEYRAFSKSNFAKYLQSQGDILTDSPERGESERVDPERGVSERDDSVEKEESLSEERFMHYFQELREVLHQEELLGTHIPCTPPDCTTPTPDCTTPTPDCTTPTPDSTTPSPDTLICTTPTPNYVEDNVTPVESPRTQCAQIVYRSNNTSVMVDSACQYSDDDDTMDTTPETAPNTRMDTTIADVECQTEDSLQDQSVSASDGQTNGQTYNQTNSQTDTETHGQTDSSPKLLSLKQQIIKNLNLGDVNSTYHTYLGSTDHVTPDHVTPDHMTTNDSVYDVKLDQDHSTAQINISQDNNTAEENIHNIQVLVNLWSDNSSSTQETSKAHDEHHHNHDEHHHTHDEHHHTHDEHHHTHDEHHHDHDEHHHDHGHSGLLTCTSVPLFEEDEFDNLFKEINNDTMRQLYNELDNEFNELSTNYDTVNRSCDISSTNHSTVNSTCDNALYSEDDSDDTICDEEELQREDDPPIATQYTCHMTSLNESQYRSEGNQTLALPFRLIKFLPLELHDVSPNHNTVSKSHDTFPTNRNTVSISHDSSPPIRESNCKSIQVEF